MQKITRSKHLASKSSPVIPLSSPEFGKSEWRYLKACLDSGWVSSAGPFVNQFEKLVAGYVGTRYGVAMMNGTSALHIALLVAGILPDEEVLVPALTFIAPANAVRYVGAWPVFIDVEDRFFQMDVLKAVEFLERGCFCRRGHLYNKVTRRKVSAIMPVHLLGHPVNMTPLIKAAKKYHLTIIEDAAESLGAQYQNKKVGNFGDIAALSFNGNKIITAGGGGMLLTNRDRWAERARYLSTQARDCAEEFIHGAVGYNYRLTNIQAALGCAQMKVLDRYLTRKRAIAECYTRGFRNIPSIAVMQEAAWAFSTYWLYVIRINRRKSQCTAGKLKEILRKHCVESRLLWKPLNRLAIYRASYAYKVEAADRLYQEALCLPCSVGLKDKEVQKVIQWTISAVS